MGQIVVEIPQKINRNYKFETLEQGEELLHSVENLVEKSGKRKTSSIIPPRRHSLKKDSDEVLGVWADRQESAEELAREIREKNRKTT